MTYSFQAQLDEQTRLLSERGMVLVGNEDEEVTCEEQDRANANGYFDHELKPDEDQVYSIEDQREATRRIVLSPHKMYYLPRRENF